MKKIFLSVFISLLVCQFSAVIISHAEMLGDKYTISISEIGSSAALMSSTDHDLIGVIGQSTPAGPSESNLYNLESGFMYGTIFSMTLNNAIAAAILGLEKDILNNPELKLSRQEKKKIALALQFMGDALGALKLYDEGGNNEALANVLNKTKSAIKKMIDSGVDTEVYQKILAQASELAVKSEINEIAFTAGDENSNITQARSFLAEGFEELLNADYFRSVQSFTQAYNEALLAV